MRTLADAARLLVANAFLMAIIVTAAFVFVPPDSDVVVRWVATFMFFGIASLVSAAIASALYALTRFAR